MSRLGGVSALDAGQVNSADALDTRSRRSRSPETLNVEGCIVTGGCASIRRKTIAAQIREQTGRYVMALKDNHKHLRQQGKSS